MPKFLKVPTRDAHDADHMAISLLIGCVFGVFHQSISQDIVILWYVMCATGAISAPLLWLRVPFAKWGGAVASIMFVYISFYTQPPGTFFNTISGYITLLSPVIVFWFVRIDYSHVSESNDI